jgi:hypothetical protein
MEINLKDISEEEFEKFLFTIKENTTFETGEYGLLLFNKKVREILKNFDQYFSKDLKTKLVSSQIPPMVQYLKYKMPNGIEILILHNEDFDLKIDLDEDTGFPKKSTLLKQKIDE